MKLKIIILLIMIGSVGCNTNENQHYEDSIDFNKVKWFQLIKTEIIDFKIDLNGEYGFFLTKDKYLYKTSTLSIDNFTKIKLSQGEKILVGYETVGIMDYCSEDSSIFFTEFNKDLIKVYDETFYLGRRTHLGDIQYSFYRKNDTSYYLVSDYNTVDILAKNGIFYDEINLLDMENGNQFVIEYDSCTSISLNGEVILNLANYKYLKCDNFSPMKIYSNTIYLRQKGGEYVKEINSDIDTFYLFTNKLYPNNNFSKKGGYFFENNILYRISVPLR